MTEEDYPELAGRIGPDERAIEVPREMIEQFLREDEQQGIRETLNFFMKK